MNRPTEKEITYAIAYGFSLASKAEAGVAITADQRILAQLAFELCYVRGNTDELFSTAIGSAESPRLTWLKKHGIATRENTLPGVPAGSRWTAWFSAYEFYYEPQSGATEDEALAKLAVAHGLKLWNEEGA